MGIITILFAKWLIYTPYGQMPIVILLDDSIYLSNENIPLKTPGNRFLTKCLKIAKKVQKI